MSDDKKTFKSWYDGNKARLSDQRKDKYANDPEHREKVKARQRAYRARKRAEREANGETVGERKKGPQSFPVSVGGREVQGWTIKKVASEINRSVDAVNHWQRSGLLPLTPLRSKRNDRLFTSDMIHVIRQAVLSRGEVSRKDETFKDEILEGWRRLGVSV